MVLFSVAQTGTMIMIRIICYFMSGVWITLDIVGYDQSPLTILNLGKYNKCKIFQ